jgi:hypothetical protein
MATQTLTSPFATYEFTHTTPTATAPAGSTPEGATAVPHRPRSALRRFLDVMMEARYRQVEHEIARYLERTGNKLTDSVERDIERRFLKP